MFANAASGGMVVIWFAFMIIAWMVPLFLFVWFIRTLNAMLAAQREIAEQLRIMTRNGQSPAMG